MSSTTGTQDAALPLEAIKAALARLPRVDLGVRETPLDFLPRLTGTLGGPRIFVKRDDLAGGPLGGNKTRMLEFVLGEALRRGADTVVGGSAAQSNYSRQLAAAAARLGLGCHLVLRRIRPGDEEVQGSLLLDHLYGARVELVDDDRPLQTRRLVELAEGLEQEGRVVYRAPQASEADKPLHAAAYASAAIELLEQLEEIDLTPGHLYVSSLDTTHAGLLLGLRAGGSTMRLRSISPNEATIFPDRSIEAEVAHLFNEGARLLGLAVDIEPTAVETSTDHVGQRYGALTLDGLEAMRLFASTEAVVLDPVYSAKAAAALIADIRRGALGSDDVVIFWHTGGLPAVFAYAAQLGFA